VSKDLEDKTPREGIKSSHDIDFEKNTCISSRIDLAGKLSDKAESYHVGFTPE
jgi:hypothetical protein